MEVSRSFEYSKRVPPTIPTVGSAFNKGTEHMLSLAYGFPAPETFPTDLLREATEKAMIKDGEQTLQYTGSTGKTRLAEWIVNRSRLRKINVQAQQVLVTNGSMQAIDLAVRTLTNEGDHIWLEAPTFFGAVRIFQTARVHMKTFQVDDEGINVDRIEQALLSAISCGEPLPKMIYVMPNYHNPTGISLSISRRKHLAELAYRYNFFILEDDAYVDLNFSNIQQPAIYHFAPERTIYLSTFSKIVAPGVRLGWAVAAQEVIDQMTSLKPDGTTNVFVQEVVANFFEQVHFQQHLDKIVTLYRQRCQVMMETIDQCFGTEVSYYIPKGGFFIWLTFLNPINTTYLQTLCLEKGVAILSSESFYFENQEYNHVRLCYTYSNTEQIKRAINTMAMLYHQHKHKWLLLKDVE
ncbi:PLP-dependent aminotransferase family protein [Amphibacillus cookii]|uniref:aminotransferase-like domain-containing protein n=1 Tax=Amphibacillus cookii TaxID=767787 RepID=UPI001956FEFA|nr:PLP-dependent aminotransferase family protein [Amphibacillus cookii]MBM7540260.1 2-aminoadipate transaminase [Amphibacillus cookii]